jgi:ATP-dependent helicase/DNAse subunit B
MPLGLITGPANSGKTGAVLDRFVAALEREPVLVLPTAADVERFEDELLAREAVPVGGRLVTFAGLVREVAAATAVWARPQLGPVQRQAIVAAVVREAALDALARAAERPGFAAALDAFLAELRAAGMGPERFAEQARVIAAGHHEGGHLNELAGLYAAYADRLALLGRDDGHGLAAAATDALRADPAAWGARPVLLHGFDDLTREQLALVEALAGAAEVTVAVVHELGRAALAARERVVANLKTIGGRVEEERPPQEAPGLLAHLERSFLADDAEPRAPDGSVVLLEAAGARAEVEQVAAEIARLLRRGARPGEIAVLARSPEQHAPLVERVFGAYAIPVAVDARVPLASTGVGRALDALLRAALIGRTSADLVAYLRAPGRAGSQGQVDRLERTVRVERLATADDAEAAWRADGRRELWELRALREAAGAGPAALAARLADLARDLVEQPVRRTAPVLSPRERLEQLAAEQAATALRELAELAALDPSLVPGPAGLAELLAALEVRRFRGARGGRVEVLGPYGARARQFRHVFVLGLEEGRFPRRARDDAFLADDERAAAGLPARADPHDEERYLFYVCLSRATKRLHLSYRACDDDGGEVARSFFVEDVLDLVAGEVERRERGLSDTVFPPALAPTEDELARSLAAWGLGEAPAALGAEPALAARLAARLARARARAQARPGPLRVPRVLAELARRDTFGASSLELYAECPFRYFVQHELRPRELAPEPDALARGALIHEVLEALYEREAPTRETVEAFAERARALVAERAAGTPLAPVTPAARAELRRVESDVVRFVRWDAERALPLELVAVEAGFGSGEDDAHPPLELGDGVRLHGKIDRIDRTPAGEAFVRDYKSGRQVASAAEMRARKRLQLPLYLLAVEELWEMPAAGAVYHPLGDQGGQQPRGLVRGPLAPPLATPPLVGTDVTKTPEEFRERLEEARAEAIALAGQIRSGHLGREPLGGSCPVHCDLHAICRRERGEKVPEENGARQPPADD